MRSIDYALVDNPLCSGVALNDAVSELVHAGYQVPKGRHEVLTVEWCVSSTYDPNMLIMYSHIFQGERWADNWSGPKLKLRKALRELAPEYIDAGRDFVRGYAGSNQNLLALVGVHWNIPGRNDPEEVLKYVMSAEEWLTKSATGIVVPRKVHDSFEALLRA